MPSSYDYDYITINGTAIRKPPEFSPETEDIYAGECTTCTGKQVADRVGWRFADMKLEWDALPQSSVAVLIAMSGENTMTFDGMDGNTHAETVVRTSAVGLRHRYTVRGEVWWKNVSVGVRFVNAHN